MISSGTKRTLLTAVQLVHKLVLWSFLCKLLQLKQEKRENGRERGKEIGWEGEGGGREEGKGTEEKGKPKPQAEKKTL